MNLYLFWAGITMPIRWGYLLIVIFSFLLNRISSRLTCLSYVLPLIFVLEKLLGMTGLTKITFEIEYLKMIAVVGVLHFGEGLLTFWFGSVRSEAVITYKGNDIAGGYQAYARWIVPLLLFSVKGFYFPIFAGIIYFNETFTKQVEEKAEKMGLGIAVYGIGIIILGELVKKGILPLAAAMLSMPAMHEGLFLWDILLEKGPKIYTYPDKGIRLMLFANAANVPKPFDRGDVFLDANGTAFSSEEEYEAATKAQMILLHIKKITGEEIYVLIRKKQLKELDPVFLPKE